MAHNHPVPRLAPRTPLVGPSSVGSVSESVVNGTGERRSAESRRCTAETKEKSRVQVEAERDER